MADEEIHNRIEALVAEEQELFHKAGEEGAGLTADEEHRLEVIRVRLVQWWDLLRQRRALREAGRDPGQAQVRDPEVVEHYEQ